MKTYEEYLESLRDGREVYYRGERVEDITTHPILKHTPRFLGRLHHGEGLTEQQIEDYFFVHPETGQRLSKFYKIPMSSEDLMERYKITYNFTKDSLVNIAHIGSDMFTAMKMVSHYMGDEYAARADKFSDYLINNNPILAGAQMDVKGDRSLRPSQQKDPDLYVHVVEENTDGIIVSGAKTHTSWAYGANEILVIPSRAMGPEEEDYGISFVIPANTKGIRMICRPALEAETAKLPMENVRMRISGHFTEAMVIFDKVLIPWDRVIVYKNGAVASQLALAFALNHRFTAVSYRASLATFLVGMTKLISEYNGVEKVAHIVKNMATLISYAEIQNVCAKVAAYECQIDPKTGIALPNPLYTNIGKLYSNQQHMKSKEAVIDTAGGMAITAPGAEDYLNPELQKDIDKYLAGHNVSGNDRFKLFLLLREGLGLYGGLEDVAELHAEGSMWPSIMELSRGYDYTDIKKTILDFIEE